MEYQFKTKVFIQHAGELNSQFEKRINKELEKLCENCDGITILSNQDGTRINYCFSYKIKDEKEKQNKMGF